MAFLTQLDKNLSALQDGCMRSSSTAVEIKRLMNRHALTVRAVAELLQVTRQTVGAWLRGSTPAPYMAAELLRRLLSERKAA